MSLNNITIHGRLVRDPELTQTKSGVAVCRFTVAVDRDFTKAGEEKQADFIDCVTWRGAAEAIAKYFNKGKEIVVSGSLQSRKWQDKEGNNRISWEIQVQQFDFCGSKGSRDSQGAYTPAPVASYAPAAPSDFTELPENDGDLPF